MSTRDGSHQIPAVPSFAEAGTGREFGEQMGLTQSLLLLPAEG